MTTSEFTALLLLACAMSFTPGPNTALSTALAANYGLRRALRFVFSVPVGWGVVLCLCALGLGGLVLAWPALRWTVKLVGVAYLLWLAWRLARPSVAALAQADNARLQISFWQGVALQFVNIKAWMLALTISSTWIVGHANAAQRFAIVLPLLLLLAIVSNLAYALIGSLLRAWLQHGTRLRWFNRAMASVLLLTAAWMVTV